MRRVEQISLQRESQSAFLPGQILKGDLNDYVNDDDDENVDIFYLLRMQMNICQSYLLIVQRKTMADVYSAEIP